jgi:hypothetical protein
VSYNAAAASNTFAALFMPVAAFKLSFTMARATMRVTIFAASSASPASMSKPPFAFFPFDLTTP